MQKFEMVKIDEYFRTKNYTVGTEKSQRSVLNELYKMINFYHLEGESLEQLVERASIAKSPKTAKMIKSVFIGFSDFLEGKSTSASQNQIFSNTQKQNFEELKEQFAKNVLKISKEIRSAQKIPELAKNVNFYIREIKQLVDLYGKLSEKQLIQTIPARFNKKPSDVEKVESIIKNIIDNPSEEIFEDLPQKGKLLEYLKSQGAQTETKEQILEKYPSIDPRSLNVEDYIPKEDPKYVWLPNEREFILALILNNENMWITGSAGLGKSTMLLQFAYEEQIPIVRTGCNYEADPNDNYFKQSFDGSKVVYYVQNAGKSFFFARMIGASINAQEEMNSSNEATMISMHSATDSIKSLDTEIGKIELTKGTKCLIAGTGNIGYKGTSDLTPALQSRLMPFEKQDPTDQFIMKNILLK